MPTTQKKAKKVSQGQVGYYDVTDAASGSKTRFLKSRMIVGRIIAEDKYSSMFLSVGEFVHSSQSLAPQKATRIFLHTDLGPVRGDAVFEVSTTDSVEGLVWEASPAKDISPEEAADLLKKGYQWRLISGKDWVLPPCLEETN